MSRKYCANCGDPIRRVELPEDPDELCACCAEHPIDHVEAVKQEAFVQGFDAGKNESSRALFALHVLEHLETEDEWSSDTLDFIAETACNLGLADPKFAVFRLTLEGRK